MAEHAPRKHATKPATNAATNAPRRKGRPTSGEAARKRAVERRSLAAGELDLPASGPSSKSLRVRLLNAVIEKARINVGGKGVRSVEWKALGDDTLRRCAHAVIVDASPVDEVARRVYPADNARSRRDHKRLASVLARLKSRYVEEYAKHDSARGTARKIDGYNGDLQAAMRDLAIKLAARLDDALEPGVWEETDTQGRHLLIRMLNSITESNATHGRTEKNEADAEKTRQALRQFQADIEDGKISVPPEDQGFALALVTRGIAPTPDLILEAKREAARRVGAGKNGRAAA
ncbi:MAG: hypothetical protein ACKVZJ_10345 [Phycisphaerales bacterium]